jgi:putative phosphoribosyl transferase
VSRGAPLFRDWSDAGTRLAGILADALGPNPIFLGLPRGGVTVAAAVARALRANLEVYVVRKIGSSISPEFAIGAVAEDGPPVLDQHTIDQLRIEQSFIEDAVRAQRQEIARQVRTFRGDRPLTSLASRTAFLVDDGIATGATVRAAVVGVRLHGPSKVVVAVPVASQMSVRALRAEADEVLALYSPPDFFAVGQFYANFDQVTDREVQAALAPFQIRTVES